MRPMYVPVQDLDRSQKRIYEQPLQSTFCVSGCAGSGKTSLAMLRIQRLLNEFDEDRRTAASFYYISKVRSFLECIREEMKGVSGGKKIKYTDYFISFENWTQKKITKWVVNYFDIHSSPSQWIPGQEISINSKPEYLLVDECQDLTAAEIKSLIDSGANIVFLGDDNQAIMNSNTHRTLPLSQISRLYGREIPLFQLHFNYRLSKPIAEFAHSLYGPNLVEHCKGDGVEKPFLIKVRDYDDAVKYIIQRVRGKSDPDLVGIPTFSDKETIRMRDSLWRAGERDISARYSSDESGKSLYSYFMENSKVKVSSFPHIKGRQFEYVFIYLTSDLESDFDLKQFYVGITRASKCLYVLYSNSLPRRLSDLPSSLYQTTDNLLESSDLSESVKDFMSL